MRKNQLISLRFYIWKFQLLSKQLNCHWELTFVFIFLVSRFGYIFRHFSIGSEKPMAACLLLQKKKIAAGGDPFSRTFGLAAHSYLSDTFRVCLAHKCDRSRVAAAAFCCRKVVNFPPIRPTVQPATIGFCLRLNWSQWWGGGPLEMLIHSVHKEKIHENSTLIAIITFNYAWPTDIKLPF